MGEIQFVILECKRASCRFRFPQTYIESDNFNCPRCGAATELAATFLNNTNAQAKLERSLLVVEGFLDNIRSSYNVGSLFRTADGVGIRHLHLGGITPTPFHPRVRKTALGAEKIIPWSHHRNGLDAIKALKDQGYLLWALENGLFSHSLFDLSWQPVHHGSILLIVGNELTGIDPIILENCDRVIALPMVGAKKSLNVAVAFGTAAYYLRFGPGQREQT